MDGKLYSSLSAAAITAFVLACLSVFGFLIPAVVVVAIPAILCGFCGIARIRKYQLSGFLLASVGICLSSVVVTAAPIWHVSQYHAESSPGFQRFDFEHLTKGSNDDGLESLIGQKICLKGYAFRNGYHLKMSSFLFSANGDYRNPASALRIQLPPDRKWNWD